MRLFILLILFSCAPERVPEIVNKENFEASITSIQETDLRVLIQSNDKIIVNQGMKKQYPLHSSQFWGEALISLLVDQGSESHNILKDKLENLQVREDFNEIINFIDSDNMTPLYVASSSQIIENIELLLSLGAEINNKNDNKENPLLVLAGNGNIDALKLFKNKELIKYRDLLIDNCKVNHPEVVQYLETL